VPDFLLTDEFWRGFVAGILFLFAAEAAVIYWWLWKR
jgi:hypothetical protein